MVLLVYAQSQKLKQCFNQTNSIPRGGENPKLCPSSFLRIYCTSILPLYKETRPYWVQSLIGHLIEIAFILSSTGFYLNVFEQIFSPFTLACT